MGTIHRSTRGKFTSSSFAGTSRRCDARPSACGANYSIDRTKHADCMHLRRNTKYIKKCLSLEVNYFSDFLYIYLEYTQPTSSEKALYWYCYNLQSFPKRSSTFMQRDACSTAYCVYFNWKDYYPVVSLLLINYIFVTYEKTMKTKKHISTFPFKKHTLYV